MSTIETISRGVGSGASIATPGGEFRIVVQKLTARLVRMMEKYQTRRALLCLTDEQLKDIGLSRADAYREGLRRPWD